MKPASVFLILALALLLGSCGFQLRGAQNSVSSQYDSMRLVTSGSDEPFYSALKQGLQDSGVVISDDALSSLEIINSRNDKRTASYSSRGKSAEYELLKEVTFSFRHDGKELIAPMLLKARRSYLYRETAAVGKAEEEVLLKQEMDQDLAQRILLALQRTVRENARNPVPPESSQPQPAAPGPAQ